MTVEQPRVSKELTPAEYRFAAEQMCDCLLNGLGVIARAKERANGRRRHWRAFARQSEVGGSIGPIITGWASHGPGSGGSGVGHTATNGAHSLPQRSYPTDGSADSMILGHAIALDPTEAQEAFTSGNSGASAPHH